MSLPTDVATWSKTQLWEYGRRKLGYGDYNPERDGPYQKWSGLEAHKLFLTMRKRNATNADFIVSVDYCHALRMRIENPVWVFKNLADARLWREQQRAAPSDLAEEVRQAVLHERALAAPDSNEWMTRLLRARGDYRREVLDEWKAARSPSAQYRREVVGEWQV